MANDTELAERVAVLETERDYMKNELTEIKAKLDDLLTLKTKGMGALGLVSILVVSASGILGIVAFLMSTFKGGIHLGS